MVFLVENAIKIDDFEVPPFMETTILDSPHIDGPLWTMDNTGHRSGGVRGLRFPTGFPFGTGSILI